MLSIFSHTFWPSICLLWRNVFLDLLPIFFGWVFLLLLFLSCMSCLYILETNLLLVASLANIFSHSVGCLFAFAVQKLKFDEVPFTIFAFNFITLGFKKILLQFMSRCVLLMFSSKSFIVSGYIFMWYRFHLSQTYCESWKFHWGLRILTKSTSIILNFS